MFVQRSGEWLSAMMGEECTLMSVETGNYITLSRVGARIWQLIEAPVAVPTLCDRLTTEFDVPAAICATEVDAFLQDLLATEAITLSPLPS